MLFTTIKLQRGATLASLTPCHFLHFGLGGFSCTPSLVVFMCLRRVVELELVFFEVLTVANGSVHVDLCSMLASWHHAIALPFDCCKGLGDAFLWSHSTNATRQKNDTFSEVGILSWFHLVQWRVFLWCCVCLRSLRRWVYLASLGDSFCASPGRPFSILILELDNRLKNQDGNFAAEQSQCCCKMLHVHPSVACSIQSGTRVVSRS